MILKGLCAAEQTGFCRLQSSSQSGSIGADRSYFSQQSKKRRLKGACDIFVA
jgi:hypothetical protein